MTTTQYIIILAILIAAIHIWTSILYSKTNKENIKKFNPTLSPEIKPIFIFRDGIAIGGLTFMLTAQAAILSTNPMIFVPIGAFINGLLLYFIYKKNVVSYYTEKKIILWHPNIFHSTFGEIDIENVEALVFATNDGISQAFSKTGKKPICTVNISYQGQKKSFKIDLEKYNIDELKDYFNKNNKPIYTKIVYERTAKRIN